MKILWVKVIRGNRYVKFLLWRRRREYSFFIWFPGGESKPHDHDVHETTYVLWGGPIFETRRVTGIYIKKIHHCWTKIDVPAGTEHVVGVEKAVGFALTFNACAGPLSMNILEDFKPETGPA